MSANPEIATGENGSEDQSVVSSQLVCTLILDYGPRKGEECGGNIADLPQNEDYLGGITAERICQSCGTVYGSTLSSEKPYNRKPTSAIQFEETRHGTSHLQTFEALRKSNFFESLNGKKDAKTYYALRHLYAGSRDYRDRLMNVGLQRISSLFERSGYSRDHRLVNLCAKEFRKWFEKRLSKSISLQLQFAQQFINENRPDTKEIDRGIAFSIKSVDPELLEKMKIRMFPNGSNGQNGLKPRVACARKK